MHFQLVDERSPHRVCLSEQLCGLRFLTSQMARWTLRRAGSVGPARNQLLDGHFRAGEDPSGPQLAPAVAAQPAQAVLPTTIRSRTSAPFIEAQIPRMSQATNPWRLLLLGDIANGICVASGKRKCQDIADPTLHVCMP